jgi:hypothetical protein
LNQTAVRDDDDNSLDDIAEVEVTEDKNKEDFKLNLTVSDNDD